MQNRLNLTWLVTLVMASPVIWAQEPVAFRREISQVSLESARRAPSSALARGYIAVKDNIGLTNLAKLGAKVYTGIDGKPEVEIDEENADAARKALEQRLETYAKVIEERGHAKLSEFYVAKLSGDGEPLGLFNGPILCEQNGFEVVLTQRQMLHHGVVVGNAIVVEHANNSEVFMIGEIADGTMNLHTEVTGFTATMSPTPCKLQLKTANINESGFAKAYLNRGLARYYDGNFANAMLDVEKAIELKPTLAVAHTVHAQMLSACPDDRIRDGKKAVESANEACKLTGWNKWECLSPLAAAYAENGDFEDAVEYSNKAIELAPEIQKESLKEQRALFEAKKPFRHDIPQKTEK